MARARLSTLDGSLLVRKGDAKPSPFKPATGETIDWYAVKQAAAASFYDSHNLERNEMTSALDRIKGAMTAEPEPPAPPVALGPEPPAPPASPVGRDPEPPVREVVPAPVQPPSAPPDRPGAKALDFDAAKRRKARERTFGRATGKRLGKAEKRAALTLRLDPDRHLRLKIYSAYVRRKIQDVLVAALDDYLNRKATGGGCACLQGHTRDTGT